MRFKPNLVSGLQRHQDQLRIRTREEHAPVIFVRQRVLLDTRQISNHESPPGIRFAIGEVIADGPPSE
jgi:hypothetical protein